MQQAERESLIEDVVGSITVKETYFFRIPRQFDLLAGPVLREVEMAQRAASRSPLTPLRLRVWSAACSTGEEPYSIGVALLDALKFPRAWVVSILATDISADALEVAANGIYSESAIARVAPGWTRTLEAYTEPADALTVRMSDRVRRLITFQRHNLRLPAPDADLDIIFCRNVMIYFPLASQPALIERLYEALRPGGWLFLGDAELLHVMQHRFEVVDLGGAVLYRKPGGISLTDEGGSHCA